MSEGNAAFESVAEFRTVLVTVYRSDSCTSRNSFYATQTAVAASSLLIDVHLSDRTRSNNTPRDCVCCLDG